VSGAFFDLEEADVLSFPGDQKHSYKNTSSASSIGFRVVFVEETTSPKNKSTD
jgi:hypothetical protein